jgi:hypothetical protein
MKSNPYRWIRTTAPLQQLLVAASTQAPDLKSQPDHVL